MSETGPGARPDGNCVLECRDLCHLHVRGGSALVDVSLSVRAGESLGIIGPNGAGKTTLLLALAGLLGPTRGCVRLDGAAFSGNGGPPPSPEARRRIGVVFQSSDDQLFSPTVLDDVAFGPLNFGMSAPAAEARALAALAAVGLEGFAARQPQQLSAGEKRRVALATVLAYEPSVLILDEPTSDLDPRGRVELVRLLTSLPQSKVIASHDLEFVLRACDRVALLDGGRLEDVRPTCDMLADGGRLREHGLDLPLGLEGKSAGELAALRARR